MMIVESKFWKKVILVKFFFFRISRNTEKAKKSVPNRLEIFGKIDKHWDLWQDNFGCEGLKREWSVVDVLQINCNVVILVGNESQSRFYF